MRKPVKTNKPKKWYTDLRITHHFKSFWKYEDEWEPISGRFHTLSHWIQDRDYDCWTDGYRIKAPSALHPSKVGQALSGAINTGCNCDYDCCGCVSRWVYFVKHIKGREYCVLVANTRNC